MARAALCQSITQLARAIGISEKTIRRCEAVDGVPPVHRNTLDRIRAAFEERGVRFISPRHLGGPGVELTWDPAKGQDCPEW